MILPIYAYGQSSLRKESVDIDPSYAGLPLLVDNMFQTMYQAEGVGLAAPQVGLDIRLVVIDLAPVADEDPSFKHDKWVMINGRIIETSGDPIAQEEGCLSLPGVREKVERYPKILVRWMDRDFIQQEEWFEGFRARVIQHEFDHLDGKLFIDHISPIRKQLIKGKLSAIIKGHTDVDYRIKPLKK